MTKQILFVCNENSARSQMAEAFFNHINKNPEYAGVSAGLKAADSIKPLAVEVMKERGIDMSAQKPKPLTLDMVENTHRMFPDGLAARLKRLDVGLHLRQPPLVMPDEEQTVSAQLGRLLGEIEQRPAGCHLDLPDVLVVVVGVVSRRTEVEVGRMVEHVMLGEERHLRVQRPQAG